MKDIVTRVSTESNWMIPLSFYSDTEVRCLVVECFVTLTKCVSTCQGLFCHFPSFMYELHERIFFEIQAALEVSNVPDPTFVLMRLYLVQLLAFVRLKR